MDIKASLACPATPTPVCLAAEAKSAGPGGRQVGGSKIDGDDWIEPGHGRRCIGKIGYFLARVTTAISDSRLCIGTFIAGGTSRITFAHIAATAGTKRRAQIGGNAMS